MVKPTVTIITPTHGRSSFLPLIYSCVQRQEWPNIQWLVDDDSPHPSAFMQNLSDPRVHYFHDPHRRSIGAKRNALIQRARGEFIAHFDDDDYYSPTYLSYLMSVLAEKGADFIKLSGFFLFSRPYDRLAYWDLMVTTGNHCIWSAEPEETVVLTPQNNDNFRDNYLGFGFSYLYRKSVGDRIQFPDVSWNEDGLFIAAAVESAAVVWIPDTTGLCLHILHGGNSSRCFPQFVVPQFMKESFFPEIGEYWEALARISEEVSATEDLLAEALAAATQGRLQVAVGLWRELLARNPYLLAAQQDLTMALFKQGEYGETLLHLETARALFPRDPMLLLWHGHVMQVLGDTPQAAADYDLAVALEPENASTWMLLAMARRDLADYPAACRAIEQFLRFCPDDPQGHFEYAQLLLSLGWCDRGFAEYEWRFRRATCPPRGYLHPRWDGVVSSGLRLLIHAEQGYGDTIQFARFIPQLVREGVDVTLACYPELVRLMHGMPEPCAVVPLGSEPEEADAYVPIMSLGLRGAGSLRASLEDVPYLFAGHPLRPELPRISNRGGKRIGFVWGGSRKHNNDDVRSVEWSIFSQIMSHKEHTFYSLQVGGERPHPWPELLTDLSPLIHDYADSAALLAQLDLVITVDTSVAHLAGAMGVPLWLLLPFAPDWRWLLQERIGPWYRELRMFRQERAGDWREVIAQVVNALTCLRQGVLSGEESESMT